MEVSVACMKDIHGRKSRGICLVVHQLEHFSQSAFRNDRVLHQKIGTDLPHETAGHLARLPQPLACGFVIAVFHSRSTRMV